MASASVRKWAHNARFEGTFLGKERVRALGCTLEQARSLPYYRLPLRRLSLASLVLHFFGVELDKSPQTSDWSRRPLTADRLAYAAADAEWCFRIHRELDRIAAGSVLPADEDPGALEQEYVPLQPELAVATSRKRSIREAVRALIVKNRLTRFSEFELRLRTARTTSLAALVAFVTAVRADGHALELAVNLSQELRKTLSPPLLELLGGLATVQQSVTFRGPRLGVQIPEAEYQFAPGDGERVTLDYSSVDEEHRLLASRVEEIRDRLKASMGHQSLHSWSGFAFSKPNEHWQAEVGRLGPILGALGDLQVAFPTHLAARFSEERLRRLLDAGQSEEKPALMWRPRDLVLAELHETRNADDGEP